MNSSDFHPDEATWYDVECLYCQSAFKQMDPADVTPPFCEGCYQALTASEKLAAEAEDLRTQAAEIREAWACPTHDYIRRQAAYLKRLRAQLDVASYDLGDNVDALQDDYYGAVEQFIADAAVMSRSN